MDDEYRMMNYKGILVTNYGEKFYLEAPFPIDKEMWQTDDVKTFLGAVEDGRLIQITVQGFTLFPEARGKVKVRKEQEEVTVEDINWLENVLADEPVSLLD